jgi:hypothetical protein
MKNSHSAFPENKTSHRLYITSSEGATYVVILLIKTFVVRAFYH